MKLNDKRYKYIKNKKYANLEKYLCIISFLKIKENDAGIDDNLIIHSYICVTIPLCVVRN